ncbi:MAG: SH3 domain-containing protein [Firmicutes bacterium]|nr:SH3 domain-containing protein [Bacillota bacterium]
MRRCWGWTLALLLLFALSSCGGEAQPREENSPPPSTEEETDKPAKAETVLVGVLVNGERINIRSGPSADSEILGKAHQGQMFQVSAQNAAPGWHQLRYGDGFAYISAEYLYLSEWEKDARFLLGTVTGVNDYVNVRSQPSDQAELLGTGILGADFVVRKQNYRPGWHQVDWQGSPAYIHADYLQVEQTSISQVLGLEND